MTKPAPTSIKILETIREISTKTIDGYASVYDIYSRLGGSKEYLRKILSQLKKNGGVVTPIRGRYQLTEKGRETLNNNVK